MERYAGGGHMIERFPHLASGYATHAHAQAVADFFGRQSHPALVRPTAQTVEAIELKADWAERDEAKVREFLARWQA
jgi:hypothetical protein